MKSLIEQGNSTLAKMCTPWEAVRFERIMFKDIPDDQVLNRPCVTIITNAGSSITMVYSVLKPLNNYSLQNKPEPNHTKKQNIR